MSENKPQGLGEPLDSPPDEQEGDDQDAKEGTDVDVVTIVDFQDADKLEEDDVEDGDDDAGTT